MTQGARRALSSVVVFCGSAVGRDPAHAEAARALGSLLARRAVTLVTGGGGVGLMKVVADACLEGGGRAIGVIPSTLVTRELAHGGLTELHVVETMHERKAKMASLADAFIALPGGFGTLDETFEALTWAQLGLHGKPIALLDVKGFWAPLIALADALTAAGFVKPEHRKLLRVAHDPEDLLDRVLVAS